MAIDKSRRDFIACAGRAAVGACALSAAFGAIELATPRFGEGAARRVSLGIASDFKMNTLTWLKEIDLFVMRNESGTGAFSSKCTHLGCTVRRTSDGFVCPCHGAKYGPFGEVVFGPAGTNLPWYKVWIEPDGRLWADLDEPAPVSEPAPLRLPEKKTK